MHFITFDEKCNEYQEQKVNSIRPHRNYPNVVIFIDDKTTILNPHYIVCKSDKEALETIDNIVHSYIEPPIINRKYVRRFYAEKRYEESEKHFMSYVVCHNNIKIKFIEKLVEFYHMNAKEWTYEKIRNLYDSDAPLWFYAFNAATGDE